MKRKQLTSSTNNTCVEGEEGPNDQLSGKVKLGDLIWVNLPGSSWWPAQVVDANTVSESHKPSNKRAVGEVLVRIYGSYEYLFVDPMKSRSEFEHVLRQNNGCYRELLVETLKRDLPSSKSSKSKGKKSESKVRVKDATAKKPKPSPLKNNKAIVPSDYVFDVLENDCSGGEGLNQRSVKASSARVSSRKVSSGNKTPTLDKDGFMILSGPEKQMHKKMKPSPTSAKPSSRIPRERSARSVKVMQSLGLIAPSGSPFYRAAQNQPVLRLTET